MFGPKRGNLACYIRGNFVIFAGNVVFLPVTVAARSKA
jgi:hypothetical protein